MFPGQSPGRRTSLSSYPSYLPAYHQPPSHASYDWAGYHGSLPDQQWPAPPPHLTNQLYANRYEPTEWTTPHYSSPPSPPATSTEPSHNFSSSLPPKPSVICSVTDFKPPHFPSMTEGGGISDPGSAPRQPGAAHPSPDSGLATSEGAPADPSPPLLPPSPPPLGEALPQRPQPARSPYEWMKRQSPTSRPAKEGRTRTKDKYRVVYSDHQRLELEKEFHYSRYITIRRKAELANGIGLSERQVKIWFQNRRAKERRSLKKQDDVMLKDKLDSPSLGAFSPPMGPMDHGFPPTSMGLGMAGLPHGLPQPHHFPQGLHGAQHFGLMKFE